MVAGCGPVWPDIGGCWLLVCADAQVIPVDDNGMDSPYSDGSKWDLQLGGAFYKQGLSCYGGCADWYAKYHIVVIATND